jgi:hypothetical protein
MESRARAFQAMKTLMQSNIVKQLFKLPVCFQNRRALGELSVDQNASKKGED